MTRMAVRSHGLDGFVCVLSGMTFATLAVIFAGCLETMRLQTYWTLDGHDYYNNTYFQEIGKFDINYFRVNIILIKK